MIQISVELEVINKVVMTGGPWAPDGKVRRTVIDGGSKRLMELYSSPPDCVFPVSAEWSEEVTKVVLGLGTPEGLRAIADFLEGKDEKFR